MGDVSPLLQLLQRQKTVTKHNIKTPAQCLPPTDQPDNNGSIAMSSLPTMIPAKGHAQSEYATAASIQKERPPPTWLVLPTNCSLVTTVLFNYTEKDEEKYRKDLNPSVDLIGEDCRNNIKSEAAVSASATAAIQGRKRSAETRHSCHNAGGKVQKIEQQVEAT
eukprot:15337354-Ditylum_brightwellii.AAC.2